MFQWLVEGNPTIYFILGAALVGSLAAWYRTRKRWKAIVAGVCAALILGLFALDRLVESDDEQMVRKVKEVAAAISRNDVNSAFQHISESFERSGKNKRQFKSFCEGLLQAGRVTDVQVWDLQAVDVVRDKGSGAVEFHFKVRGSWGASPPNYFGKVEFVLDPDHQWRVKSFDVHDSLNQSKTPVAIPGW